MRVLVVDDEAPARERLRRLLEELGEDCVGEAATGEEALALSRELHPDAVLLDIRMPGTDGMAAARAIQTLNDPPAVIFTTAYSEHAIEAFDARATDYLLKPVRKARLEEALGRVRPQEAPVAQLKVQHQGNVSLLPLDDVYFLQADSKYVLAHHNGGVAVLDESLRGLEEQFPHSFVRVHRNALVASHALRGMQRDSEGTYRALLRGSDEKPEISRRHVTEVREWLRQQAAGGAAED